MVPNTKAATNKKQITDDPQRKHPEDARTAKSGEIPPQHLKPSGPNWGGKPVGASQGEQESPVHGTRLAFKNRLGHFGEGPEPARNGTDQQEHPELDLRPQFHESPRKMPQNCVPSVHRNGLLLDATSSHCGVLSMPFPTVLREKQEPPRPHPSPPGLLRQNECHCRLLVTRAPSRACSRARGEVQWGSTRTRPRILKENTKQQ